VNRLVGGIGRLQKVLPVFTQAERFDGQLFVCVGHDDVAGLSRAVVFDGHQVTVKDARVSHTVAADPVQGGSVGLVNQVIVQRQQLRLLLADGLGHPRADGPHHRAGKEQLSRRNPPVHPLQVAGIRQAPHQGKDAGG
jgi:hypothetical protein